MCYGRKSILAGHGTHQDVQVRAASNTDIDLSRAEAAFQRAIVWLKVAKSVGA